MGELAASSDARFLSVPGAYWRRDRGEISASSPGGLLGSGLLAVGRRTRGRRLMAQQKSEDRVLLEGGVMPAERAGSSRRAREGDPVDQTAWQLCLPIATAEDPEGSACVVASNLSGTGQAGVPQAIVNAEQVTSVTMEGVVSRLTAALVKVVSNKGASGPDGLTVSELREQWPIAGPRLATALLDGSYRPGATRRVIIPKVGGGQRGLGIPNVTDRVVCEAVRQVSSLYSSRRSIRRVTGSDRAVVATRRSRRPRRICKMGTGGWWTSIWRSSSIGSATSG